MKKMTFILILLFLTGTNVVGQSNLGIRAGLLISTMTGRAEPQAVGVGSTSGIVFQQVFSDHLGLNVEALFNTKGYVSRIEMNGDKVKTKLRLQYLDIPISIRTYFGKKEGKKGFVGAGPHIGIGLYEKSVQIKFVTFGKEKTLSRDPFSDDKNRFEAGVDIELGYIAKMKERQSLEFTFRHYFGLTKVSDVTILGNIRNIYVGISLAYLFSLN